jgi:predicted nuclease of restriction endonuclease-like (RecB) superfamily
VTEGREDCVAVNWLACQVQTHTAQHIIRDSYVFEFLDLLPQEVMRERKLENALLNKLQAFFIELGHGFCFEARQKRLTIGGEYCFVDLVSYHRKTSWKHFYAAPWQN